MSRPLRIQYPGALYHVMNRGTSRLPTFFSADNKRLFLQVLSDAVSLWKVRVHAFCLMSNHYHLLLETPLANLSRAMRHIDGVYTQRINRLLRRDGALFRGRFKSILVQKESYFLALLRYIHMNGVKAGLVDCAGDDLFCSHRLYLNPALRPEWLTVDDVLTRFGGDTLSSRQLLDVFVHAAVGETLQRRLDGKNWPAAIGGSKFLDYIRATRLTEERPHPEKPQEKEIRQPIRPEKILQAIEDAYGLSSRRDWIGKGKKGNEPRRAAMHLLRKVCQLSYTKIGEVVGGVGYGTVAACLRKPEPNSAWYEEIRKKFSWDSTRLKVQI